MNAQRFYLYISGDSANSRRARANVDKLCDMIPGGCDIEIVDVRADPGAAEAARVIATPMLVSRTDKRPRRVVGDLSNLQQVMAYLGLAVTDDHGHSA